MFYIAQTVQGICKNKNSHDKQQEMQINHVTKERNTFYRSNSKNSHDKGVPINHVTKERNILYRSNSRKHMQKQKQ